MQETVRVVPPAPSLLDEEGESIPENHEEHFRRWRPEAERIPESELKSPHVEGSLAAANTRDTYANLERAAKEKGVSIEAISANLELARNVYGIALAYVWVTALMNAMLPRKPAPVGPRLRKLRKDRQLMLCIAEAAAILGQVEEALVEKIRKGSGQIDHIEDVLLLTVILPRDVPAVVDSGLLVSHQMIRDAKKLATELQGEIRPVQAQSRPAPTDAEREAITLLRRRMWTLLVEAHAQCELIAAHIVGIAAIRSLVPALGSRVGLKNVVAKKLGTQTEA